MGFYGVGEEKLVYSGILFELEIQLGDNLKCATTVAVFPNN